VPAPGPDPVSKIPIRATLLSAMSVVPYVAIFLALNASSVTKQQFGNGIRIAGQAMVNL
jgi:hypothetical protein